MTKGLVPVKASCDIRTFGTVHSTGVTRMTRIHRGTDGLLVGTAIAPDEFNVIFEHGERNSVAVSVPAGSFVECL
jgi:hypothetical protein